MPVAFFGFARFTETSAGNILNNSFVNCIMIIYNVTVSIDNRVAEEWLQWMKEVHIPEVMATTYFIKYQIARVMEDEDHGGTSFAIQYTARNMDDLMEYQRDHATTLQAKHAERYKDLYVAFRTVLEVID